MIALLPALAAAQPASPFGWSLACETSRIPIGSEDWDGLRLSGLSSVVEEQTSLTSLETVGSILLLLRPGDEHRTVLVEARGGGNARSLSVGLNGIALGTRRLRSAWTTLEYPIPAETLARGPNVLRLEVVRRRENSERSEPVLLHRIAVEPATVCRGALPVEVDLAREVSLMSETAVVLPQPWRKPSKLAFLMATRWPKTSVTVSCVNDRAAHWIATISGGNTRRRASVVPTTGDCSSGLGLVLVADGPGSLDLRHLRFGPQGPPWTRLLGVPLFAGLGLLGAGAVAASALLGSRREALVTPRSRIVRGLFRASEAVRAIAKSPFIWLLSILWLTFLSTLDAGGFHPKRVNDTQNYEELLEAASFSDVFVHHRTLGYPLFLKLAGWQRWDIRDVPVAHALFFGVAVIVFWFGARAYTSSGWLAFWAAAPFAWSPLLRVIRRVQPDFLGAASSVVVVGLLMLLAARRDRSVLLWTMVAGAVFASYQIRPGNVFLIGFLPLAAVALRAAKYGVKDPMLRRFAVASLIAALGPFALYGTLRWIQVGHFGLVSYGGFQVIGVTSPMLDDELVAEIPEDLRSFAAAIVEEKQRLGLRVYTAGSPLEYWFRHYNTHVWRIAVPIARRLYEEKAAQAGLIVTNERFTALSHAIIARRPLLYADWIARSFGAATAKALREPWVLWPLVISAAALAALAARRFPLSIAASPLAPLTGLLIVATVYYTIHMLLVVAVEATVERYYVATVVFIPGALCALAAELGRRALASSTVESGRD